MLHRRVHNRTGEVLITDKSIAQCHIFTLIKNFTFTERQHKIPALQYQLVQPISTIQKKTEYFSAPASKTIPCSIPRVASYKFTFVIEIGGKNLLCYTTFIEDTESAMKIENFSLHIFMEFSNEKFLTDNYTHIM